MKNAKRSLAQHKRKDHEDFTGKRFGRWTILSRVMGGLLAQCDCGAIKKVMTVNLRSGASTSCGCKNADSLHSRANNRAVLNALLRNYKYTKRPFTITDDFARHLLTSSCHYCGSLPIWRKYVGYALGAYANGIDRVNSDEGYVPGNVVSCCYVCNRMKAAYDLDMFLAHIKNIYEHTFNK